MKRIGILIGWLVWAAGVSAQSWSLDDCMKYAVEHATEVKREVVNARQRKQDYQHAVAGFLPTVTGGVQGQYAWGRNIDPETNTYNNVTTFIQQLLSALCRTECLRWFRHHQRLEAG